MNKTVEKMLRNIVEQSFKEKIIGQNTIITIGNVEYYVEFKFTRLKKKCPECGKRND